MLSAAALNSECIRCGFRALIAKYDLRARLPEEPHRRRAYPARTSGDKGDAVGE